MSLFIPVIDAFADNFDHDRTFWGIRFPIDAPSFHQSTIHIVQEHLEQRGKSLLQPRGKWFDLSVILLSIITETDWKFVKHSFRFILFAWVAFPLRVSCGPLPQSALADRNCMAGIYRGYRPDCLKWWMGRLWSPYPGSYPRYLLKSHRCLFLDLA